MRRLFGGWHGVSSEDVLPIPINRAMGWRLGCIQVTVPGGNEDGKSYLWS